jgi:hypothetical protein
MVMNAGLGLTDGTAKSTSGMFERDSDSTLGKIEVDIAYLPRANDSEDLLVESLVLHDVLHGV